MGNDWFRSWHGAPTDPKWLAIARRSGAPPGAVSAVMWALLDRASQDDDRGSVAGFDPETYAAFSGFDIEQIIAILKALHDKGVIVGNRLAAWDKRQPKREDATAAERKAEQRLRDKEAAAARHAMSHAVTPPAEASHNVTLDKRREDTDKNREDSPSVKKKKPRSIDLGKESPPAVPTTEVAIVEPKKEALEERKKSGGKRKTLMREDWKPSQTTQVFALERMGGSFAKVGEFTEEFRQYWIGRGDTQADWNARFRSRIMTQFPQNGGRKNGRQDRQTAHESFNDGMVLALQARLAEGDDRGENYPLSAFLPAPEPGSKN